MIDAKTIETIENLRKLKTPVQKIITELNSQGFKTTKGKPFTLPTYGYYIQKIKLKKIAQLKKLKESKNLSEVKKHYRRPATKRVNKTLEGISQVLNSGLNPEYQLKLIDIIVKSKSV